MIAAYLRALYVRLFGAGSVDSAVAGLNIIVNKLNAIDDEQTARAETIGEQIYDLMRQRDAAYDEAYRASVVARKVKAILS